MSLRSPTFFYPFHSVKCVAPVPTADELVRWALIWASIDGSIMSISRETITRSDSSPPKDCLLFETSDAILVLDVVRGRIDPEMRRRDEAAWRAFEWTPLTLLSSEIEREPRFVNSRRIWREYRTRVPADLRIQMLSHLRDDGPMRMHELLSRLRADRDPLPVLFSMACGDEVEIDLDGHLGPDSMVSIR